MKQAVSDENSFINRNIFELKRTDRRCNMVKPSIDGFRQNKILKNLGDEDLHVLAPHLELVQLSVHQRLFEYGCNSAHVYFPTTAIISLLFILLDGSSTEISVAGNEGMVGISALMGETALGNAVVQSAGYAYRLKASVMKQEYRRGGVLQRTMMRYMQVLFAQMAQNCVCSRHYSIEKQLCRFILDRFDRSTSEELKVTHEAISNNLGVRRESITDASKKLQSAGLLQCRRGYITILNRKALEEIAGECYEVARIEFDRM